MRLPDRLGFRGKTLWDWLQLLIVPAILIALTVVWSAAQTSADNKREDRRIAADRAAAEEARQDATLQAYLDEMSGLMLDKKLLASKEGDAVRAVALTVTLTALRRLDGERQGEVVRFLHEARLLRGQSPLVLLEGADLGDANLKGADLAGANLRFANLMGADLSGDTVLSDTDLGGANLRRADLGDASLFRADLLGADLRFANLGSAHLRGANLGFANLTGANLRFATLAGMENPFGGAYLKGADLRFANLKGADLRGADLAGVDLKGAQNLDLDRFITELRPDMKKDFLDSQRDFLDSLSREDLSKFNLSPEKLAKFRRETRSP